MTDTEPQEKADTAGMSVVISPRPSSLEGTGSPNQKDRPSNAKKGGAEAVKGSAVVRPAQLSRCSQGYWSSERRLQSPDERKAIQQQEADCREDTSEFFSDWYQHLLIQLLSLNISLENKQHFAKNCSSLPTEAFKKLNLFWNWTASHRRTFYWLLFKWKDLLPTSWDSFLPLTLPAQITGFAASSSFIPLTHQPPNRVEYSDQREPERLSRRNQSNQSNLFDIGSLVVGVLFLRVPFEVKMVKNSMANNSLDKCR